MQQVQQILRRILQRVWQWFRQLSNRNKIIALIVFPFLACCSLLFVQVMVETSLRSAGILPTLTPTPSNTPTVTNTVTRTPSPTPVATDTPQPTDTPEPTDTPAATDTPPPTDTPRATETPTPSPVPATATPAPTAVPTAVPTAAPTTPPVAQVVITSVNKQAEYVDIQNIGGAAQDLAGWRLVSERGNQECGLSGVLEPGQTLRIWAMAEDAGQGGFNCGFGTNIWNNSESDPAVLYDAAGNEVSRR